MRNNRSILTHLECERHLDDLWQAALDEDARDTRGEHE